MSKLPHISSNIPRDLRQYVERAREAIQELETRAAALEAAAARPQSVNLSPGAVAAVLPAIGSVIDDALTQNYATPPAPLNLVATGAFSTIILDWDPADYFGHAYTEIWAATTNDLGEAVMVGQTPGSVFSHSIGNSATRWYWIRFVNVVDVKGPYNAVAGVEASTADDPDYLIGLLSEEYGTGSAAPFFQIDTPTVINGVTVPAGTYMKQAFIADATISRAKIQNAAIDSAKIADLAVTNAKISALDAGKITTGFLDAARIQTESITASKIDSRSLTIKDASGNVIFSSGVNLDYARVGGTKPPADADKTSLNTALAIQSQGLFATLNQINSGNVSTYIASAAISNAYISSLDAGKISTGLLNAGRINLNGLMLENSGGSLSIKNAGVSTSLLAANAVTIPLFGVGSLLTGNNTFQTAITFTFTMPVTGDVVVLWSVKQGYSVFPGPTWGYKINLNGGTVDTRDTMGATNDYPTGMYLLESLSGSTTVQFQWKGSNSDITGQPSLMVIGVLR